MNTDITSVTYLMPICYSFIAFTTALLSITVSTFVRRILSCLFILFW
jgi:hypothetical protein